MPKRSTRKKSPKRRSPRKTSPKRRSVSRKKTSKRASPKKRSPRKASPKRRSPRKASPKRSVTKNKTSRSEPTGIYGIKTYFVHSPDGKHKYLTSTDKPLLIHGIPSKYLLYTSDEELVSRYQNMTKEQAWEQFAKDVEEDMRLLNESQSSRGWDW